jgi:hypothetical protein
MPENKSKTRDNQWPFIGFMYCTNKREENNQFVFILHTQVNEENNRKKNNIIKDSDVYIYRY